MAFIAPIPVVRRPCTIASLRTRSVPCVDRSARRASPTPCARRTIPRAVLRGSSTGSGTPPPPAFGHSGVVASSGLSCLTDTTDAIAQAFETAVIGLEKSVPKLAIVGVTADRDPADVSAALHKVLGTLPHVGATSCGAVLGPKGPLENGVSVLLLGGWEECFRTAVADFADGDVEEVTARAAERLKEDAGLAEVSTVYLMATPGNEEAVMRGVESVFGKGVAVIGGSAADNDVSGSWTVYRNSAAKSAGVVMAAFCGPRVNAGAALVSPYVPSRRKAKVTRCEGRKLITLDGKPAADVLYELVGEPIKKEYESGGMILGPMSTRPYALLRGYDYLAVHVAAINEDKTVSLFAEAREGDVFVEMANVGGGDSASAAGHAIAEAYSSAKRNAGIKGQPAAALLIYCGGLGIAVGDALAGNMTNDFGGLEGLPDASMGFTAFGEQGPVDTPDGTDNQHRNLSVGMLVIAENTEKQRRYNDLKRR